MQTFTSLGFEGVPNVATMRVDRENNVFLPVEVVKADSPIHRTFLISNVMRYVTHVSRGHNLEGLVAAIAYFLDGHVEYAHTTNRRYVITGGSVAPDYFRSAKCPVECRSNEEYISYKFRLLKPVGLMLYQEIPSVGDSYLFRVVHEAPTDEINDVRLNESFIERLKQSNKLAIIDNCLDYLQFFLTESILLHRMRKKS